MSNGCRYLHNILIFGDFDSFVLLCVSSLAMVAMVFLECDFIVNNFETLNFFIFSG